MKNANIDLKEEGEKLMKLSREWSDLVKTRNVDTIVKGWAQDAVMMAPGYPPLRGREAIRRYVEEALKVPGFSIRWEPLEVHVSGSGDMAYMIERNQITVHNDQGNPVTEYNKTVTVWRKEEDGSWKNVVDMWNSDPDGQPL